MESSEQEAVARYNCRTHHRNTERGAPGLSLRERRVSTSLSSNCLSRLTVLASLNKLLYPSVSMLSILLACLEVF